MKIINHNLLEKKASELQEEDADLVHIWEKVVSKPEGRIL